MYLRWSHFQYGKWFARISIMVKRFEESPMNRKGFHLSYANAVEKIQFWCNNSIMMHFALNKMQFFKIHMTFSKRFTKIDTFVMHSQKGNGDSPRFTWLSQNVLPRMKSYQFIRYKKIELSWKIQFCLRQKKKKIEILSWEIQHNQRHNFGQAFCLNQKNLSKTERKGGL